MYNDAQKLYTKILSDNPTSIDAKCGVVLAKSKTQNIKDFLDKKGFEKEQDDFDKILFKHLKPEMHIPWEDRWAWDKEGNHRVRYTLGICVGPTDEQCFVMGKNAEYRQMVGLDKGEQENDG